MINFLSHLGHLPRLSDALVNQRKLLKLKIQVVSIPLFVQLIPFKRPLLGSEVLAEREGFGHIGVFAPTWYPTLSNKYFVLTNINRGLIKLMDYNIATYVTTRIRPLLLTPEFRFFTNPAATTISPGQKHFFQNFNFPGYNLSLLQILANSVQ